MYSEDCTLNRAAEIVDLAALAVFHLAALREKLTDKEWDELPEGKFGDLIDSICDLEYSIEEGRS